MLSLSNQIGQVHNFYIAQLIIFENAIWITSNNVISACAFGLLYGWNVSLQTLHSCCQNTQSWIFQQNYPDDTLDLTDLPSIDRSIDDVPADITVVRLLGCTTRHSYDIDRRELRWINHCINHHANRLQFIVACSRTTPWGAPSCMYSFPINFKSATESDQFLKDCVNLVVVLGTSWRHIQLYGVDVRTVLEPVAWGRVVYLSHVFVEAARTPYMLVAY